MELRHLRYFVAVAEEGSLTVAAERRLHTAQPSLSRQMQDLEYEVGTQLMVRSVRGIELTAAGRVFLDHARLALAQVEAGREGARRAAEPTKPSFALGFLTGQEMNWLPEAMRILHGELPNLQVTIASQYSPDLAGETFISVSKTAPVLRVVIDDYLKRLNLDIKPDHEVDNLAMAMSLVASTRGVALLPAYARNFLPWSVISRPIKGDAPTIDLVIGYNRANTSPTLKLFLSRLDELIARVSQKVGAAEAEAPQRNSLRG